ncbi:efflux RND transporter periplasmic adaptor subunit [Amycolatopsis magusensis]|uniref:Peptidoglycan hydrolase-like protein with peptidoglycan-binding domain n=1 Tax=Amycolatopsis magusensis TaxID=882444 RepID=A0ABS4PHN5_9PSEU|nr:peptidoglycan-binding protein [Amycolatopsis magusensis]MBP2178922.1 peptidoglycan hydrolase-like protein with peptidoglycan-binding domain [Amycolatopsis magusensis]MDI5975255.1 peptidoglycan-binding domain-containing protein [Amycolatopsis magusensis]
MRRKVAAGVAVVVVAGAATAGMLVFTQTRSEAGDTAASELPPSTAEVARQTLNDSHDADGELGYGVTTTISNRLPGTLTSVPEGDARIARGQALYKVDDKPVVLMYGSMPAYRNLADGVEGLDVRQLEENLRELGYTGFTVDDEYTSATATAVANWQEDLGLDETGIVELGRVVFADGELRVDSVEAKAGEPATPGQKVLTHTGVAKAITVELEPADQRLAKEDTEVQVELPDGKKFTGRVDEVSTIIQPGEGQNAEPTTKVEVIIGFDDQQAAESYALASVDVTFTADKRENVLTVPVAALLALAEGGFGVEVVEGGATRYVPVDTGLFADGRVEISGSDITEGTVVGVPK